MTMEYRAPISDEAQTLADLGRDSFVATFGHLYAPQDLALFISQSYTAAHVSSEMANPKMRYRIALLNGKMIGYCKVGFGVTLDYDPGDRNIVELKQLYLLPDAQGTGAGQALMDWAFMQASDAQADAMILSVYHDNPRAQRFYQRNGFTKIADTYFMVGNHRDDEFLYLKSMR